MHVQWYMHNFGARHIYGRSFAVGSILISFNSVMSNLPNSNSFKALTSIVKVRSAAELSVLHKKQLM